MSVVAAKVYKDKIVIAADTQTTWGQAIQSSANAKLFKIKRNFIIGSVGDALEGQFMRLFCDSHFPKSSKEHDIVEFMVEFWAWCTKKKDSYKPSGWFLIAFDGKLFSVTSGLDVTYHDYWAIGSGWEYARAALHIGHDPVEAVKVACDLTIYCGEPIESYEVKI